MKEKEEGWVQLHRKTLKSDVWQHGKYTIREFWIYLLLKATYKTHHMITKRGCIEIKRGEIITSLSRLQRDCERSKNWIKNTLKKLKMMGMIDYRGESYHFTRITICNFDRYNKDSRPGDAVNDEKDTGK